MYTYKHNTNTWTDKTNKPNTRTCAQTPRTRSLGICKPIVKSGTSGYKNWGKPGHLAFENPGEVCKSRDHLDTKTGINRDILHSTRVTNAKVGTIWMQNRAISDARTGTRQILLLAKAERCFRLPVSFRCFLSCNTFL